MAPGFRKGPHLVDGEPRPVWWRWRGFIALFIFGALLQGALGLLKLARDWIGPAGTGLLLLALGFLGAWVFAVAWSRGIVRGAGLMGRSQPWWSRLPERAFRQLYLEFTGRPPGEAWYHWALKAPYRDQAVAYLEQAALARWPDALFELGLQQEAGEWGRGGRLASIRHYLAAAQLGHGEAAFRLAEILRWGGQDPEGARRWYLHSARQGFGPAMAWLARAFELGDGFPIDTNKADAWKARLETLPLGTTLRQATHLGKPEGPGSAGRSWLMEALQDSTEALAELPGYETSARWLTWLLVITVPLVLLSAAGFLFLNGGVFGAIAAIPAGISLIGLTALHFQQRRHMGMSRGARRIQAAADQGNLDACHTLGLSYLKGDSDHPPDTVAARRWFLQAAQGGHLDAMTEVGELLAWGVGGPKDPVAARTWLERAAATGHAGAHAKLGRMAAPEGEPQP